MADNYDDVMAQVRDRGLLVTELIADGRTHRCRVAGEDRERRGWTLLHTWTAGDGAEYIVGAFGVWHGNDPGTQKVELKKSALTDAERQALRDRLAADRRQAKAARVEQAKRAARRAAKAWAAADPSEPPGGCAYLKAKAVGAYGVRFTESGALVVPMTDARGQVHGLQFILPEDHPQRAKLGRGKTYWPAGLMVHGHYHLIGNPGAAGVCLVAEGYATGASLHAATGLPVAIAFAANNLQPVAAVLAKVYRVRLLICGDDDYLTEGNPGQAAAAAAALAVNGAWCVPQFPADRAGAKLTDFNDLQQFPEAGAHAVREQITGALERAGYTARAGATAQGGGDDPGLKPLLTIDEACERYSMIYGGKATLFDHWEHVLVPKSDVLDVLPDRGWSDWKLRPDRKLVRMTEVGFDPAETDERLKCNLWAGWPTSPVKGSCDRLLELLDYLCNTEQDKRAAVRDWVLNDQSAVEDKFNDWASKKLFMVCDEVVARMELYHTKNKLKALITGDWIRINPKNVAAHEERNHVNLVFLSNERQPLVLDRDDRRYMVVYVPEKLDAEVYREVGEEIKNGGIEALHYELANRDLGDFKPWTAPIQTRARDDLIEVSLDSSERFLREWQAGETAWPFGCCGSMQLYTAYRRWASANGVRHPRESNHFLSAVNKSRGWAIRPCHVHQSPDYVSTTRSQKLVLPDPGLLEAAGQARRPDQKAAHYYTDHFFRFAAALEAGYE